MARNFGDFGSSVLLAAEGGGGYLTGAQLERLLKRHGETLATAKAAGYNGSQDPREALAWLGY